MIPGDQNKTAIMGPINEILESVERNLSRSLEGLFELLRFPSVATDSAHHGDCLAAANWLVTRLEAMGFKARLRETTGRPLVFGEYVSPGLKPHAPHILFYGHYDVQPVDPVELWDGPPFEPRMRTGKNGRKSIFARGSSDDKGQLMTFLEASRAWLEVAGGLPFRLTVLIEGDEEGDSSHLDLFLKSHQAELRADAAFVCDTDLWDDNTPGINTMLRGCICEEVHLKGPRIDLHSGYYGGPAGNPIKVLSRILAAMHDGRGRVAIPGFYDGVKPPPLELRKAWAKLKFPARKFLGDVGLSVPAGEDGFSVLEQIWARPTAEINGIHGGYRGPGSKTVLPAEAVAKLSFRLVEGQNPRKVRKAFRDFVKARLPKDCRVSFESQGGDSSGVSIRTDSPWIKAASRALAAEWGKAPVCSGSGGSIPVVESFKKHLGLDSLLVGFARHDDGAHSPNEKYDVECFHRGIRSWARIISEFA